jgi:hypothetical protein
MTDFELLLVHLKGQDNSLDPAFSSDEERASIMSSEPMLTVTQIFCRNPGPTELACSTFGAVPIGCQRL